MSKMWQGPTFSIFKVRFIEVKSQKSLFNVWLPFKMLLHVALLLPQENEFIENNNRNPMKKTFNNPLLEQSIAQPSIIAAEPLPGPPTF